MSRERTKEPWPSPTKVLTYALGLTDEQIDKLIDHLLKVRPRKFKQHEPNKFKKP